MSTDREIAVAKAKRASVLGQLTKLKNFFLSVPDNITIAELETRLGMLESYALKFDTIQTDLEVLDPQEIEGDRRSTFDDSYCTLKTRILTMIGTKKPRTLPQCSDESLVIKGTKIKNVNLPKLTLSMFSGEYADWPNYYSMFMTLVDSDEELSPIEKFQHLRSSLMKPALRTIDTLDVTAENYTEALGLFKKRYNNNRSIFQTHIRELFELRGTSSATAEGLRNISDSVNSHLRSLQTLGSTEQIADGLLLFLIGNKLDAQTQSRWEEEAPLNVIPAWTEMSSFLEKRCQTLENMESAFNQNTTRKGGSINNTGSKSNSRKVLLTTDTKSACLYCNLIDHNIYNCHHFIALPIKSRISESKRLGLCLNCLRKGHLVKDCKSKGCRHCKRRHNTFLHLGAVDVNQSDFIENTNPLPSSSNFDPNNSPNSSNQVLTLSSHANSSTVSSAPANRFVYLATALVLVRDKYGKFIPGRAVLDSASQLHFVTRRFAQLLAVNRTYVDMSVSGINSTLSTAKGRASITFCSRICAYSNTIDCFILPSITDCQHNHQISLSSFNIPKNIELADPLFYESKNIDILIGASLFFDLLCVGQIRLGDDKPIMQKTRLGWIVSGNFNVPANNNVCMFVNSIENASTDSDDASIEVLLKRFWELDSQDEPSQINSPEENDCEKHFAKTHIRCPSGQYAVRLPFKAATSRLGSSFETACKMFYNLEAKLNRNPQLKQQYTDFINEYKNLGHMSLAPMCVHQRRHFFLPHHCVLKEESTTTKLRVVFNGSAKTSSGLSLNDLLMVGPTIQEDLFSALLVFRTHRFVLTADIAKMYRCVLVQPPDAYMQCILWRDNSSEELKVYVLNTVTYGTASAAFLAIRSLHQLAFDEATTFPIGSKIARSRFYVDDMLAGADTLGELTEIKEQTQSLLARGGFHLRKWCSNSDELLQSIPAEEKEEFLQINDGNVTKTLGIIWEPKADEFWFSRKEIPLKKNITKRSVVSSIARLYDPLGFVSPVIVQAKIFVQTLWKEKLNWDETLPAYLHSQWQRFCDELCFINKIKVPRYAFFPQAKFQLHGFADASSQAYGACIYVRSEYCSEPTRVRLLCSKSRVAPTNTISIPKLELCAALILAQLIQRVLGITSINFINIFCWSDSTTVLSWLASPACTWTTFVANRVAKIQTISQTYIWRHVRSDQNPADILSRGMTPSNLSSSTLWFQGPSFLLHPMDEWPTLDQHPDQDISERRTVKSCLLASGAQDLTLECIYHKDFIRLRRTFSYIQRFITNTRLPKERREVAPLNAEALDAGLKLVLKIAQFIELHEDYKRLQNGKGITISSVLKDLNPFIDEFGLLRVGGRLKNSSLGFDMKHKLILPRFHKITETLILHFHFQNMHAGCQALTAILRERFWPLGGKHNVRRIINKCVRCFKARPVVYKQLMGDLPEDRVKPSRPFSKCGVDFCGPFYTKSGVRGRGPIKTYVSLFICMSTKAVHMELAIDLSTTAFLSVLRRFVSRRGKPHIIYSDNATNFVGANSKLGELRDVFNAEQNSFERIYRQCVEEGINWRFIPARSPHFGGLWEASIKLAKFHLRRVVGYTPLSFDDLHTLICQVESIINSRPLYPLSDDPDDLNVLTPGHFLVGEPLSSIAEPDFTSQKINRLKSWQLVQSMQQTFWNKWAKEYLSTLQQRRKWRSPMKNLSIGNLVLIKDDNLPPLKWSLGRIVDVFPGSDNLVRVVNVKTQDGILKRAVTKICVLPIEDNEQTERADLSESKGFHPGENV